MADKRQWTTYTNDDFEPWAIFVQGHVPLAELRAELVQDHWIDELEQFTGCDETEARDWLQRGKIEHFYIRNEHDFAPEETDEEYPWHFCHPDAEGAIAVSGMRWSA